MKSSKFYRHAQTQHGGEIVDLENILLCKANLSLTAKNFITIDEAKNVIKIKECANNFDSEPHIDSASINSKSTQCVWIYDVVDDYFTDKEKVRFQNYGKCYFLI